MTRPWGLRGALFLFLLVLVVVLLVVVLLVVVLAAVVVVVLVLVFALVVALLAVVFFFSSQKCVKLFSSQKCVKRNRLDKNREKISHKRKTTMNFQKLERESSRGCFGKRPPEEQT